MKCFNCQHETVESTTTYFKEEGEHFFIIKNVPCYKCTDCGEIHYSLDVLARVEEIIDKLKEKLQEVNITAYTAA